MAKTDNAPRPATLVWTISTTIACTRGHLGGPGVRVMVAPWHHGTTHRLAHLAGVMGGGRVIVSSGGAGRSDRGWGEETLPGDKGD